MNHKRKKQKHPNKNETKKKHLTGLSPPCPVATEKHLEINKHHENITFWSAGFLRDSNSIAHQYARLRAPHPADVSRIEWEEASVRVLQANPLVPMKLHTQHVSPQASMTNERTRAQPISTRIPDTQLHFYAALPQITKQWQRDIRIFLLGSTVLFPTHLQTTRAICI